MNHPKIPLGRRLLAAFVSLTLVVEPALAAAPQYMLQVPITGITAAPAGDLSVAPSPVTFGSPTPVGAAATAVPVTVTNNGFSSIQNLSVALPSGGTDFAQSNNCPGTLPGRASCTVTLGFVPTTTGQRDAQLAVSSNAHNGLQLVPVTGSGVTPSAALTFAAFAATQVGQSSSSTVTVSNTSPVELRLTAGTVADPMSISAGTCGASLAAGASCTYRVSFAPTSTSAASVPLKVTFTVGGYSFDKTVNLTGTGQAASATLTAVAFGNVAAGVTKDAAATLTNTGVGPITVGAPSVTGAGFALGTSDCGSSLAVGESCSVGVHLTGIGLTAHAGTLTVPTLAGTKTAALTGQSQQAIIAFEPATYAFGTTQTATTTTQGVTLRNSGNIPTGALSFGAPSGYSVSAPACAAGIPAGGTCSVTVSFTPASAQSYAGNVSASGTGLSATLGVTGAGQIASATLTPVAFGNLPAGTTASHDATLTNTGVGPLTLGSPTAAGSGFAVTAGGTCGATLAPGATCTVKVALTAAGITAHTGTLSVPTSEAGTKTAALTGQSQQASISVTPTSRAFPDTRIGNSVVSAAHTLTNGGNIAATGLVLTAPAGFGVSDSTCSTSLAAGASCSFTITFAPTTTTPYAASVTAASDNGGTASVAVTGTGTLVSVATLTSAAAISLADWYQSGTITGSFTYRNDGNTPMTLANPALASPLSVASNTCSAVAAGASCTITVALTRNGNTGGASAQSFVATGATTSPSSTTVNWSIYSIITAWSTTALDFGSVQVGQTSTKSLTLTNTGSVAANFASSPTIVNAPAGYSFDLSACSNVVPNGSCNVSVAFSPTSAGTLAGSGLFPQASSINTNTLSVTGVGAAQAATITDVAFGNQAAGATPTLTSTLTNTGVGPLSVTPPAAASVTGTGFSFVSTLCSTSLAAGASCTTTVRYTASGTAAATGALAISTGAGTKTAALSGQSQQATISVTPTSRAFGSVQVGQTVTSAAHTVTNSGNIAATGLAITAPTGYGITSSTCSTSLAGGGSCTFAITFSPGSAQSYSGNVSVASTNAGSPTVAVTGSGQSQSATITAIAYGNQAAGSTTDLTSTLTNTGVGPLTVVAPSASSVTGTGFSFLSTLCSSTLAAGASCTTTVRYTATGTAAASGSLAISTGAGTQTAALSGQSQQASLTFSPASLSFGTVQVGQSKPLSATITNVGNITATGLGGSVPAGFSLAAGGSTPCSNSVAAGASCGVVLTFTPTAAQAYSGVYSVPGSNIVTATQGLSGTGQAQSGTLTPIAYGARAAGATTDLTSTLTNTGIGPLSVTSPVASNVAGTGFSLISTTCSTSLASGGTCSTTVRYTASGTAAASGTLTIVTGAGNLTAALSGQSQQAILSFSPASMAFGSQQVGQTSATQNFTLTNVGNIATTGQYGTGVAGFNIVGVNNCTNTLAPGATCTGTVSFSPTAAQAYSGNYGTAATNASNVTIALTGTGTSASLAVQSVNGGNSIGSIGIYSDSGRSPIFVNNGSGPVEIRAHSVDNTGYFWAWQGPGSNDSISCYIGQILAPGATCRFFVGAYAGTVSDQGTTETVTYRAQGTATDQTVTQAFSASFRTSSVNVSSVNFGTAPLNTWSGDTTVRITNAATGDPLRSISVGIGGANAGTFRVSSNGCSSGVPAGGYCDIVVQIGPTSASTGFSGTLSITGGYPRMDPGEESYIPNPTAVSFSIPLTGNAAFSTATLTSASSATMTAWYGAGQQSASFTYRNDGTAAMSLSNPGLSAPLSVGSNNCSGISPGSSCTIAVAFTSTAAGAGGSSSQTFTPGGANNAPAASTVNWSIYSAVPRWSTTSLSFGSVMVGNSSQQNITLYNDGSVAYDWATNNSVANLPAGYSINTGACGNVAPGGGSCNAVVTFAPGSAGSLGGGSIYMAAESYINNSLSVSGTGVAQFTQATLISASSISLSGWYAASTTTGSFTYRNDGNVAMSLSTPGLSSPLSVSSNSCSGIGPGGTCAITVSLALNANGGGSSSQSFTAAGASIAPAAATVSWSISSAVPQWSNTSLAFGTVNVGSSSTQNITLTNIGSVAYNWNSALVNLPTGFTASTTACSNVAPNGGSCVVPITFTPTSSTTFSGSGISPSAYSYTSNTLSVTGTGAAATTYSFYESTTPSIALNVSGQLIYTVTNTGSSAMTLTKPSASSLTGTVTGATITFSSTTCGTSLAQGSSCTITLTGKITSASGQVGTKTLTVVSPWGNKTASTNINYSIS